MITCNIFKKERTSKEGRKFNSYLTRITNKNTHEEVSAGVKFEEGCDAPKEFPIRIDVTNGSVSPKKYQDPVTKEEKTGYTLWVREWKVSAEKYVDNSLDEWKWIKQYF